MVLGYDVLSRARVSFPTKRWLVLSLGGNVFLFLLVLVLIARVERLKPDPEAGSDDIQASLPQEDGEAWSRLKAFGTILGDYGWHVDWNEPVRYTRGGTVALLRAGIHSNLPDDAGETTALGVDALTFAKDASLPPTEVFPLERWQDLHPSQRFSEGIPFTHSVKRSGHTYFIFYQYNEDAVPSTLADQFEVFLYEDTRQRAQFRRELAAAHARRMESLEAIQAIQQALLQAGFYKGEIDGLKGWRTKHGLQRFLRHQGLYRGDIDGVFGNRTLEALEAFRVREGLEASDAIDSALAEAIQESVKGEAENLSEENEGAATSPTL